MVAVIDWPSRIDFANAIAHPAHFLSDPELRGGAVAVGKLGLPLNWAGQYATVFQLGVPPPTGSGPPRQYAIRCFAVAVQDHQQRYAALQQRLDEVGSLDCLSGFEYQAR